MRIDAVVFDFDGVIIDTETARYEVWKRIFMEHNQVLPREIWVKSIGRTEYYISPYELLSQLSGKRVDADSLRNYEKSMEEQYIAQKPLTAGLLERISEARNAGGRFAIASSASRRYVEKHLAERNILSLFDVLVCRDDVSRHKPHPEPYLRAVELLDAEIGYSFAVEDAPAGIEAAVSAGLFCIAVAGNMTRDMDQSRAHCIVESLEEFTFKSLVERKNSIEHYRKI
ncbi:MAG TPA: HAD family phosphatase [Chitinispirillaceae bacterium]|nr:HAD family phosphatase [Chitinispirillaceae bacterium]